MSREHADQAVEWIDKAIEKDPDFARAYAWRACAGSWMWPPDDQETALATAKRMGVVTAALLGPAETADPELLASLDVAVHVPTDRVARIQELQMLASHLLCEQVERALHR